MKQNISTKKLKKKLLSGNVDLSADEIRKLIFAELQKEEKDIDNDFIDACTDWLDKIENGFFSGEKPRKRVRPAKAVKIALAAALVSAVILSAASASARFFHFDIPGGISKLTDDTASIENNLQNADTHADGYQLSDTDLAKRFEQIGIFPITYPELYDKACTLVKIEDNTDKLQADSYAYAKFDYGGKAVDMLVSQADEGQNLSGETGVEDLLGVTRGELIRANGLDVLVFEQDKACSIVYCDGNKKYNLYLEVDFDTAVKFAKSIK